MHHLLEFHMRGSHLFVFFIILTSLQVDMLVGDIYGGRDYSNIGLSADTIASSFGKVISQVCEMPRAAFAEESTREFLHAGCWT